MRRPVVAFLISLAALAAADDRAGDVAIRIRDGSGAHPVFEVVGLDAGTFAAYRGAPARAASDLRVYAIQAPDVPLDLWPTVLGTYEVDAKARVLRFTMRFSADPGLRYRAMYRPRGTATALAVGDLLIGATPSKSPPTSIVRFNPIQETLPENLLKFYIEFSAPMSRGHAYEHLKLLDGQGKPLDLPFLELGEELWDPRGKRFTLLFDPGRIKRGVKPRVDLGPVLQTGKSYTLVIDRGWLDAEGRPLFKEFRKTFKVGPPDGAPPDPKTWTIQSPAAGTREPLVVTFPEPLDHALLDRCLDVAGVAGAGEVMPGDDAWEFRPDDPWKAGPHEVVIDRTLEDLAGNSIGRPFDVDVFNKIEPSHDSKPARLPFRIEMGRE